LLLAIALLAAFAVIEARDPAHAMFDVRLFRRPDFVAIVTQPFAITLGFVVLLAYLPPYLQGVTGRSVLASGLLLLPLTVPVLVMPVLGAKLAARTSLRAVLLVSALLNATGALTLLTLHAQTSWLELAGPLVLTGAGVGLAFGVMDNAAVSTVPLDRAGAASGIFNTMRLAGESIAIAGAAAVLTSWTAAHLPRVPHAATVAGHAVQGQIRTADRAAVAPAFTSGLHLVAIALATIAILGAVLSYLALDPDRDPATR
jgi:predicted MFS family arabinose efflux permease